MNPTKPDYDTIIIGLGIMGSATLATLAARGQRVLGLERFDLGHVMGSSHGVNRILRVAYFEGAAYVPLVQRAARLWRDLGQRIGEDILFTTGSLDCAPKGHITLEQARDACLAHDLVHEELSAREIMARFPAFHVPEDHAGLFQPDGGFVASDRALAAYQFLAIADGAEIHAREAMLGFEESPDGGVLVRSAAGVYKARRLVLAAGGWMGEYIPALKSLAVPERQVLGWFLPETPADFALGRFPASILWTPEGHFYQFPLWGAPGFKIGCHRHFYEQGAADSLDRETHAADEALLRKGLAFAFPKANGPLLRMASCLYTVTPDEHFIIDHLPGARQVIIASPCSGHGFKFGAVMGEILADMAMDKPPGFDLSMFRLARFQA